MSSESRIESDFLLYTACSMTNNISLEWAYTAESITVSIISIPET